MEEQPKSNPWSDIAGEVANLVAVKNKAYGSSFEKSGAVMAILYPEGITPEKMGDALVIVRMLDKMFRIATDRDALGEDPFKDLLGYSLLATELRSRARAASPGKHGFSIVQDFKDQNPERIAEVFRKDMASVQQLTGKAKSGRAGGLASAAARRKRK